MTKISLLSFRDVLYISVTTILEVREWVYDFLVRMSKIYPSINILITKEETNLLVFCRICEQFEQE